MIKLFKTKAGFLYESLMASQCAIGKGDNPDLIPGVNTCISIMGGKVGGVRLGGVGNSYFPIPSEHVEGVDDDIEVVVKVESESKHGSKLVLEVLGTLKKDVGVECFFDDNKSQFVIQKGRSKYKANALLVRSGDEGFFKSVSEVVNFYRTSEDALFSSSSDGEKTPSQLYREVFRVMSKVSVDTDELLDHISGLSFFPGIVTSFGEYARYAICCALKLPVYPGKNVPVRIASHSFPLLAKYIKDLPETEEVMFIRMTMKGQIVKGDDLDQSGDYLDCFISASGMLQVKVVRATSVQVKTPDSIWVNKDPLYSLSITNLSEVIDTPKMYSSTESRLFELVSKDGSVNAQTEFKERNRSAKILLSGTDTIPEDMPWGVFSASDIKHVMHIGSAPYLISSMGDVNTPLRVRPNVSEENFLYIESVDGFFMRMKK